MSESSEGVPTFREKWLRAVEEKNSVLCAGLDPAEYAMGRENESLPQGRGLRAWALDYVRAVAPFSAGLKPNVQYWKGRRGMDILYEIGELARELGMVVIDDSKLADIGATNDAGMFYASQRADAVTLAPFAGNIKEAASQAKKRGVGLIGMCLMSNPEYATEKNKLVPVGGEDESYYNPQDVVSVESVPHVRQYVHLTTQAKRHNLDGIVIGAPSSKNHITGDEIERVRAYVGDSMLVLLPGVGKQGGEAQEIWKYFGTDNVIVNVGRALMFPNGSNSTPQEQEAAAEHYFGMLNSLRQAA